MSIHWRGSAANPPRTVLVNSILLLRNKKNACASLKAALLLTVMFLFEAARGQSSGQNSSASLFDLDLGQLLEVKLVTAASGFEQSLEEAPASVTTIEAEQWQAMGASTLLEAIDQIPGLHISMVQTGPTYEKVIMRGLSGTFGQQVLLLVDGLPFRSARDGGAPWAQWLPLNGFKRIEIIRGSGSAVYGADAVGGIINLVSYKPGEQPGRATLEAGDHNTYTFEASNHFSANDHHFEFAWSSQYSDVNPDRVIESDFQTVIDRLYLTRASLAPGPMNLNYEIHTLKTQWHYKDLTLRYLDWNNAEYGTGAGSSQVLDPVGRVKMRTRFLNADYDLSDYVSGDMNVRVVLHHLRMRSKFVVFPPGSRFHLDSSGNIVFPQTGADLSDLHLVRFPDGVLGHPGSDNRTFSTQINHVLDLSEGHKFRWAIGWERTHNHSTEAKNFGPGVYDGTATSVDGTLTNITGTEYVYLPTVERESGFIALQDQWQIDKDWVATLGVRYDDYSDFGSTTNPRVGLVWQPTGKVHLKAFAGSAFRAPSFVDLYSKNNPSGVGNPHLDPESVDMMDVGLSANYVFTENLQYSVSLFKYAADKLVAFTPRENVQVAENSGLLKVRGIEQSLSWRWAEKLTLEANMTALDAYRVRNVDISAVPKLMANMLVHYRRGQWHWFIGGKWVADRERADSDTRPDIDDYLRLTSRLQYSWNSWQFSLMMDNALDEDMREPSNGMIPNDYPLTGRYSSLQLTKSF